MVLPQMAALPALDGQTQSCKLSLSQVQTSQSHLTKNISLPQSALPAQYFFTLHLFARLYYFHLSDPFFSKWKNPTLYVRASKYTIPIKTKPEIIKYNNDDHV